MNNDNNRLESYLKAQTMLYVEDEQDTQDILATILEDYVGNLILASNGQAAFQIFKTTHVDIVLTDILMPKMNGIELAKKIRAYKHNNNIPIIFATAFTDTQFLLDSIKIKCHDYILKPIVFDDLLEILYTAILPQLQMREITMKNQILNALNIFLGGKKVEIVQYIVEHCTYEQIFYGSHEEIADALNLSRPTVAKIFQQLIDLGLLEKIKNKTYRVCYNT